MSGRSAGLGASNQIAQADCTHPADHLRAFAGEILDCMGATLPKDLIPGQLVRFDDPYKPSGNHCCWAVFHSGNRPAGAFGNWRTGERHTWRADVRPPSREDREQTYRIVEAAKLVRAREVIEQQQSSAKIARDRWTRAAPATVAHAYLAAKRVPALGLRVLYSELLVPMRTVEGELVNLQKIGPNGYKLFLKGGRIRGCFSLLEPELPERGECYICEGWATAATVRAQTQLPVAAAMTAGNLKPVAEAIHAARPLLSLVIAADNDHATAGNPGIRHGRQAARAVDGTLTWPKVCGRDDCVCTDFNDVQHCGKAPI